MSKFFVNVNAPWELATVTVWEGFQQLCFISLKETAFLRSRYCFPISFILSDFLRGVCREYAERTLNSKIWVSVSSRSHFNLLIPVSWLRSLFSHMIGSPKVASFWINWFSGLTMSSEITFSALLSFSLRLVRRWQPGAPGATYFLFHFVLKWEYASLP